MFKKSKKIQIWTKYKKAYFLTKQENYHFLFGYKISRLRKIMDNMMKNKKIGKIPKMVIFGKTGKLEKIVNFGILGENG